MGKIGLCLGALAVAAGIALALRGPVEGAAATEPRYRTAEVAVAPVRVTVAATGVVEPSFKVEVKSKASGAVVSFPLEPGDPVEAGAPLVALDPADEARNVRLREAEVTSNRASLTQTNADLGLADGKLTRAEDLHKRSLLSPEEYDAARFGRDRAAAAVELQQSALVRSEIALEEARQRLADTKIVAPISGVLLTKAVDKGHIIASGITSVSGGTTLATIADMSRVFVVADVDEADVGRVKVGAPVRISADAFRDVRLRGKVERVMPLGVVNQNVMIFKVKIEVTSPEKSVLLPNMTADVQIHVAEKDEALVVPSVALRRRDRKTGVEVMPADGATPEFREVTIGLSDGSVTEVEGVKPGEKVVVGDDRKEESTSTGFRMFGIGGSGRRPSGAAGTRSR